MADVVVVVWFKGRKFHVMSEQAGRTDCTSFHCSPRRPTVTICPRCTLIHKPSEVQEALTPVSRQQGENEVSSWLSGMLRALSGG
jgi:hypothetical protein